MRKHDLTNNAKFSTHKLTIYGNVITLTGTSGTANITINGYLNKTAASFVDDLTTTAKNWVSANYDYYRNLGFIVSAAAGVITVAPRWGWQSVNSIHATIANATTNLAGTLAGHFKPDFAKARVWQVTFGQNITIDAPLNAQEGNFGRFELTASGAFSVTYNTAYQFAGGTEHTQTSTGLDIIEGKYNASAAKFYVQSVVKDVKA